MIEQALLWKGNDGALRLAPPTGRTYKEVKDMLGATWDDETDAWKFPALRSNVVQVLETFGQDAIDMSEAVLAMGDGHGFPLIEVEHTRLADLFGFQKRAVQYLVSNPHGSLLNMSPGLGKTAVAVVGTQARAVSATVPEYLPCLIVAPASLLHNWWREIEKWSEADEDEPGPSIEIAHGNEPLFGAHYTITSYDMVVQHPTWFHHDWALVILDESVLVKNRAAQRTLAIAGGTKKVTRQKQEVILRWSGLRKYARKVWLLSGSPTTRYADDLYPQFMLTWPAAFKSFWRFAERVCIFEDNIWAKTGKEIVGTKESIDLEWEFGDIMLTVNQEDPDVLPDLPEYLYETLVVDLGTQQKRAYQTMLSDFLIELRGKELKADNKLSQLIRLQQITSGMANFDGAGTASAKADLILESIEAQAWQYPILIWTHWKGSAQDLTHRLSAQRINAEWVSGDDSAKARDRKLEAYKAGRTDVLVLSLGVGKFGHTLTNTRTVVYHDKTWAADDYIQSLRRVRRIGLTWRPLLVTLKALGTADELLEMNLAGKMPSIAKVTNSQLSELLQGLGL